MSLQPLCSRWTTTLSTLARSLGPTRNLVNHAAKRPVPPARGESLGIKTPEDFLKAIGRSSETKLTIERWEDLWRMTGHEMKKAGLDVRDRRYILWCMEKYRHGLPISQFAHEAKPKKTIRGWGPSVQNGKRIRSRRIKSKK